jgi:hypothetical protein
MIIKAFSILKIQIRKYEKSQNFSFKKMINELRARGGGKIELHLIESLDRKFFFSVRQSFLQLWSVDQAID